MSDYKPGTVAMVTYKGERVRAFKFSRNMWTMLLDAGSHSCNESLLTDITPLVCIEATLEDADLLQGLLSGGIGGDTWNLLVRTRDAIRAQIPEPLVIPERLGAVVEDTSHALLVYAPIRDNDQPWADPAGGRCPTWAVSRCAVRVLSEGVSGE